MKIDLNGFKATESTPSLNSPTVEKARTQTAQPIRQRATEDTTSLSAKAVSVHSLTRAALNTDSRTAKVEQLRQAVSSGQYPIDPARIALALSKADV